MLLNLCSGITFPCIVQVKSLHMGPKCVCAQATIRTSALEVDTTAPVKPDPTVSLIHNEIHTCLPWNLAQKVTVYFPLPWGWWQANQIQEQAVVHGARAVLPTICGSGLPVCPMLAEPEATMKSISRAKTCLKWSDPSSFD